MMATATRRDSGSYYDADAMLNSTWFMIGEPNLDFIPLVLDMRVF